jgi:hypothetical protein
MNEPDLMGNTELFSTLFSLFDKQRTHVNAGADNAVGVRPSTQHFARTTTEVAPKIQRQGLAVEIAHQPLTSATEELPLQTGELFA